MLKKGAAVGAPYESVFFGYARNLQTVTHVIGERWDDDAISGCFPLQTHGYINTFGWEFRYDGARARYAGRQLRTNNLHAYVDPKGGWSDYAAGPGSAGNGEEIYADFRVNASGPPSMLSRYEPGIGRMTSWPSPVGSYYHTDQLGTIRGVTDSSATWTEPMAFTAFGERKVGTQDSHSTRFGYVGSFGYQAHAEFPFLHVGARYYDPATGRFLQRDPIGIRGGLNVYAYVFNRPTVGVDPTGKGFWGDVWSGVKIVGGVVGGIVGGALIGAGTIGGAPIWVAGVGVVIFVGGTWVAVSEIVGVWDTANKVVDPIRPGVKRRNKAVDDAMNCYPSSG